MLTKTTRRLTAGAAMLLLTACISTENTEATAREAITAGMQRYASLVKAQDADAIAQLFTEDGEMGTAGSEPQRGREAIRKFLKSFTNVKVLSDEITVASVDVAGSTGIAHGSYRQTAQVGTDAPMNLHGSYEAEWKHEADGRWLVHRMTAYPDK